MVDERSTSEFSSTILMCTVKKHVLTSNDIEVFRTSGETPLDVSATPLSGLWHTYWWPHWRFARSGHERPQPGGKY